MNLSEQLAENIEHLYFGENWIGADFQSKLKGLDWQQAITQVHSFHAIATLVFHLDYYVAAMLRVLDGGPLDAKDERSFDHAPITSGKDWNALLEQFWGNARQLIAVIAKMPESKLNDTFVDEKYGTYARNFNGLIQHHHYHLGQISLIKSMVAESKSNGSLQV